MKEIKFYKKIKIKNQKKLKKKQNKFNLERN